MSEPDKDQWFVVHVLSGQEQKVFESRRVRVAMKLERLGFRASQDRAWKADPNG